MKIRFRPHHFLCALAFEGKGYSDEFVRGFQRIVDALRDEGKDGDLREIEVVGSSDSICHPCPNRRGKGCETEEKIARLDRAHSEILGVSPGEKVSWGVAKNLLAQRMTDEAFEKACAPCSWKSLGVCKKALEQLREEKTRKR